MKKHLRNVKTALFILPLLWGSVALACAGSAAPTVQPGLQETLVLELAFQTLTAQPTASETVTETPLPTETATPTPTETATPTQTSSATFTPTPLPTLEPTSTATPLPTDSGPPTLEPGQPTPTLTPDLNVLIPNARILVYEDSIGAALDRTVSKALEGLNLTGDNVVNTADAAGNFERYLRPKYTWDMIIFSAENRYTSTRLGGVIWDEIIRRVREDKIALVVEAWYLDQISGMNIYPLLDGCGVRIMSNWTRSEPYEAYAVAIYDFLPDHIIFHQPNPINMPLRPATFWANADAGDLMRVPASSKAELLAGLYTNNPSKYGLITSCYDGRVIFQTFSTHDYHYTDMVALWQNYIVNTLAEHFTTPR